ncbi:MAG: ion channel [Planctomycetaceae bacterium]
MIYLSAVVFTTLGFGDELPVGLMRPIANLEAILGAVFLSLITASIFRQVIRR